jgi:tRNA threonylcarbamoyladenosine biosynthesis protein TsaE
VSGCEDEVQFVGLDLPRLGRFAELLHQRLPRQIVIGLKGTLGAGKTRLVQMIAVAAGIDVADVTSPTFTIVQHYRGTRLIHHIDAYRLADEDEFIELGGEELYQDTAMVLIEWPERIAASLPPECLMLEIEIEDRAADDEEPKKQYDPTNSTAQSKRTIRASSARKSLMKIMHEILASFDERVGGVR